jgi:hypothetical protein
VETGIDQELDQIVRTPVFRRNGFDVIVSDFKSNPAKLATIHVDFGTLLHLRLVEL